MTRILRIELRRSAAAGAALTVFVIGSLLLYLVDRILFDDGWMQLAMTQRWYLALLWPLALAAGAWQARREHRSNVAELFAGTPRPRAVRVLPTLAAMAVGVTAGYLAMGAAGAVRIAGTAEYLPAAALAVTAVGVLSLTAAVWLGLAAGRLLPSPVTAPVLAVAGLAALLFTPWATRPHGWLALVVSPIYSMNLPDPYATVPGVVSTSQAIWAAGLAGTAVLLLASGTWRTRLAALLPVLACAALAVTVMPRQDRAVFDAVDAQARELVCAAGNPAVCVSRVHTGLLPAVVPGARDGLAALARLPQPPTAVHEDTTVYARDDEKPAYRADVVLVDVTPGADTDAADVVAGAFAGPQGCDQRPDSADQLAAAAWLTGREPAAPRPARLGPAAAGDDTTALSDAVQRWQALRKMPERDALTRVAALRAAATTCTARPAMLTGSTP